MGRGTRERGGGRKKEKREKNEKRKIKWKQSFCE